jgi:hypothetical protein
MKKIETEFIQAPDPGSSEFELQNKQTKAKSNTQSLED